METASNTEKIPSSQQEVQQSEPETKRTRTINEEEEDLTDAQKIALFDTYRSRERERIGRELAENIHSIKRTQTHFPHLFREGTMEKIEEISFNAIHNPLQADVHVTSVHTAARLGEELLRMSEKYQGLLKTTQETPPPPPKEEPPEMNSLMKKENRIAGDGKKSNLTSVKDLMTSIISKPINATYETPEISQQQANKYFYKSNE